MSKKRKEKSVRKSHDTDKGRKYKHLTDNTKNRAVRREKNTKRRKKKMKKEKKYEGEQEENNKKKNNKEK